MQVAIAKVAKAIDPHIAHSQPRDSLSAARDEIRDFRDRHRDIVAGNRADQAVGLGDRLAHRPQGLALRRRLCNHPVLRQIGLQRRLEQVRKRLFRVQPARQP